MRKLVLLIGIATIWVAMPDRAPAAEEHRAVVVVDTGEGEPRRACVVFTQPSITGLDALRAARMDPVVQTYSGQGGAVCALCGVGCSAGSSCLTCQAPKYWQYWRSVGGTGSYSYSNTGAGSTQVRDGDVEGWNWGEQRSAPPYYSVDAICSDPARTFRVEASSSPTTSSAPPPPPRSTTTAPPPRPPATTPPAASASSSASTTAPALGPGSTAATLPGAVPDAVTTSLPPETPTTTTERAVVEESASPDVAPTGTRRDDRRDGGSPAGLVALAVLLAAVIALTVRAARAKRNALGGSAAP